MRRIVALSLGLLTAVSSNWANGYERLTHEEMTRLAIAHEVDFLNARLREMGLSAGVSTVVRERQAEGWIVRGSNNEDNLPGPFFHFHNPLRPLDQAGLDVPGLGRFDSLIKRLFHKWSAARSSFDRALTLASREERDAALMVTLLTTGHLVHLVQDSSVPAHVRNDAHLSFGDADAFHLWVDGNRDLIPFGVVLTPPAGILQPRPDGRLPIASLVDFDRYDYTTPGDPNSDEVNRDITLTELIGLSEFANANFFSDDTTRGSAPQAAGSSDSDVPRPDDNDLSEPFDDGSLPSLLYSYRSILERPSGPVFLTHGVVKSTWIAVLLGPVGLPLWAESVHHDYAVKLIPRAIGYSARLLEYFFRGSMTVQGDATAGFTISNTSQNENVAESMDGTFSLYYDGSDGARHPVPGATWELSIPGASSSPTLTFTPPTTPMPINPGEYMLVFHGTLGVEMGAVAGRLVDIDAVSGCPPQTVCGTLSSAEDISVKLPGYSVDLRNATGGFLATTRTDTSGAYSFSSLTAAGYFVVPIVRAGQSAVPGFRFGAPGGPRADFQIRGVPASVNVSGPLNAFVYFSRQQLSDPPPPCGPGIGVECPISGTVPTTLQIPNGTWWMTCYVYVPPSYARTLDRQLGLAPLQSLSTECPSLP